MWGLRTLCWGSRKYQFTYRGILEKGADDIGSAVCYSIYTIYLSLCIHIYKQLIRYHLNPCIPIIPCIIYSYYMRFNMQLLGLIFFLYQKKCTFSCRSAQLLFVKTLFTMYHHDREPIIHHRCTGRETKSGFDMKRNVYEIMYAQTKLNI